MKGPLGLAPERIIMKCTGTSETMCFEKMMQGWILGIPPPQKKKKLKSLNIKAEL